MDLFLKFHVCSKLFKLLFKRAARGTKLGFLSLLVLLSNDDLLNAEREQKGVQRDGQGKRIDG